MILPIFCLLTTVCLSSFYNKLFIITADHGHTEMAAGLTYVDPYDDSIQPAEMSCKLNIKGFNREDVQEAEKANNNLHIWELGEVMSKLEEKMDYGLWSRDGGVTKEYLSLLTPKDVANTFEDTTAVTANIENANIVTALNGPMAHIYVRGNSGWGNLPDYLNVENIAEIFRLFMQANNSTEAESKFGLSLEDYQEIRASLPNLKASIDAILIRQGGAYKIFNGIGKIPDELTTLTGSEYIKGLERISGMNNPDRSGDIILIFKDFTNDLPENRYTSGVSCKSWHGSLNPSDSYVPLIVAYPGGNKFELEPVVNMICPQNKCEGNWEAAEIIFEMIYRQYSGN